MSNLLFHGVSPTLGTIDVFSDRMILKRNGSPRALPLDEIEGLARNYNEWLTSTVYLGVRVDGEWLALPGIPNDIAGQLIDAAKHDRYFVEGWPDELRIAHPAPPAPLPDVLVREYATQEAYQAEAPLLAADGYEVVSTTTQSQNPGCLAIATFGLLSLLFRPKPHIIVTYRRATA